MSPDADMDTGRRRSTAPKPTREAAIALARSGAPLNASELRAILQIKHSAFYYHAARGHYDRLKTKVPLGPRQYSGALVTKWLDGDPVYTPTFGKKQERRWDVALKKAAHS